MKQLASLKMGALFSFDNGKKIFRLSDVCFGTTPKVEDLETGRTKILSSNKWYTKVTPK